MYAHKLNYDKSNTPIGCSPLDVDQLAQNTFGDSALRDEVIQLFIGQLGISKAAILNPENEDQWRFTAHTLKGVAAAVGARHFVELANAMEQGGPPLTVFDKEAMIAQFDLAHRTYVAAVQKSYGLEL